MNNTAARHLSQRAAVAGRGGRRTASAFIRPMCQGSYLTRRQVTSALPPIEAGSVHFNSSPVNETTTRFCSVPVQFGYVLPSTLKLMALSAPTV